MATYGKCLPLPLPAAATLNGTIVQSCCSRDRTLPKIPIMSNIPGQYLSYHGCDYQVSCSRNAGSFIFSNRNGLAIFLVELSNYKREERKKKKKKNLKLSGSVCTGGESNPFPPSYDHFHILRINTAHVSVQHRIERVVGMGNLVLLERGGGNEAGKFDVELDYSHRRKEKWGEKHAELNICTGGESNPFPPWENASFYSK
ncbi:hypothetical protein R3P38DRAFT_2788589 [Favolaschia claudopus]|uniref:Wall-associated receptor kinase galacturonan-binding domain-containing protein n=1 Tax=Favolaschia claudopus TaxID=2862362 RepID=A0AAW0AJ63_9AGAR